MQPGSSLLSPYLQTSKNTLTLATNLLGTGSIWLLALWTQHFYEFVPEGGVGRVVVFSFSRNWDEHKKKLTPSNGNSGETILLSGVSTYLPVSADKVSDKSFRPSKTSDAKETIRELFAFVAGHVSRPLSASDGDEATAGKLTTAVILEGLDLFLATLSDSHNDLVPYILEQIHSLRRETSSVLISLSADSELLSRPEYDVSGTNRHLRTVTPRSSETEPLEKMQTALLLSLVHVADSVLSLRLLETGYARDVSGIVSCHSRENEDDGLEVGKEFLYFLGANGAVKVWQRGAG